MKYYSIYCKKNRLLNTEFSKELTMFGCKMVIIKFIYGYYYVKTSKDRADINKYN